jgi:urease accessory protein
MDTYKFLGLAGFDRIRQVGLLSVLTTVLMALWMAPPALAHHPMGGNVPSTFIEGFLSGLAHPIIGIDHFVFIIASGLLATVKRQGLLIPLTFVTSTLVGTGFHYAGLDLPGVELLVSGTILMFGILLTRKDDLKTVTVLVLSTLAGMCHGYAYGEAILGAQTTSLLAYLIGFTIIQLGIAAIAFMSGKRFIKQAGYGRPRFFALRSAGLVVCGIGIALLFPRILEVLLPLQKL